MESPDEANLSQSSNEESLILEPKATFFAQGLIAGKFATDCPSPNTSGAKLLLEASDDRLNSDEFNQVHNFSSRGSLNRYHPNQ